MATHNNILDQDIAINNQHRTKSAEISKTNKIRTCQNDDRSGEISRENCRRGIIQMIFKLCNMILAKKENVRESNLMI